MGKKYSEEEIAAVLEDAKDIGVTKAARSHGVSVGSIYNWQHELREAEVKQRKEEQKIKQKLLEQESAVSEPAKFEVAARSIPLPKVVHLLIERRAELEAEVDKISDLIEYYDIKERRRVGLDA